jgi:hypothetical protein
MALLNRNTLLGYRSSWLEALYNLALHDGSYSPQISSSLTAATMDGGFRTSPVDFTISSSAMSTASNENQRAHPSSHTPSAGIVAARLLELEPKKDHPEPSSKRGERSSQTHRLP